MTDQPKHPALHAAAAPLRVAGRGFRYLARVDAGWQARRKTAAYPLFRWASALGLLIWCAVGSNPASLTAWATHHGPWLILAGALAFGPEIASIRFGGFRLDTITEDVRELRGKVENLQIAQASAAASSSSSSSATAPVTVVVVAASQAGELAAANKGVRPASDLSRYFGGQAANVSRADGRI